MLRNKAMLVRLSISQWSGRRFDKKATTEVENNHGSTNIGRFNKTLVDPSLLKGVQTAASRIRNEHYTMTMPWDDADSRLLPSAMYFDYTQLMQELESAFWNEVDKVMCNYEDEVARSCLRLGDLFDESEYPSVNNLRARYGVKWSVVPIPDSADFRVDVGEESIATIRTSIEADVAAATKTAVSDIWRRMSDVMDKAYERLSDPKAVFRDSLIGNIEELCELIPKLNILDDPDLNQLRDDVLSKMTAYPPNALRSNSLARKEVADNAVSILKSMDHYMGAI